MYRSECTDLEHKVHIQRFREHILSAVWMGNYPVKEKQKTLTQLTSSENKKKLKYNGYILCFIEIQSTVYVQAHVFVNTVSTCNITFFQTCQKGGWWDWKKLAWSSLSSYTLGIKQYKLSCFFPCQKTQFIFCIQSWFTLGFNTSWSQSLITSQDLLCKYAVS